MGTSYHRSQQCPPAMTRAGSKVIVWARTGRRESRNEAVMTCVAYGLMLTDLEYSAAEMGQYPS